MLEHVGRNEWIIILTNVIFFMVVQTLFFKFIASKQYENVLENKLDMVKDFVKRNPKMRDNLKISKSENKKKLDPIAKKQLKEREKLNRELTWLYCGIPIVITAVCMAYVLFVMKKTREWSTVDSLGVFYVIFAYSTEILFFFFMVKKYEFVGDQYIVSSALAEILKS
jgi:hypothetical protein